MAALPFKLLPPKAPGAPPDAGTSTSDEDLTTAQLGEFFRRAGIPIIAEVRIKPAIDDWYGWRVDAGDCAATVLPDLGYDEAASQVKILAGPGEAVRYVYRGVVSKTYPTLKINFDLVRGRLLRPFGGRAKQDPRALLIVAPANCTGFLAWPWEKF